MFVVVGVIVAVAVAVGLVVLVRKALLVVTVDGFSMAPTLHEGDRVLALRRRFGGQPRRNSIVVLRSPFLPDVDLPPGAVEHLLVKRVSALAGDPDPCGQGVIPTGSLFIVGDSEHSDDSRRFGPIPENLVLGTVIRHMR